MDEFEPTEQVDSGEIKESRELADACREILEKVDCAKELKLTNDDCDRIAAMSPEDAGICVLGFMYAADIENPMELLSEKGIVI